MATRNSRDVKLTLGVETTGAEEIDKLKTSVEQLAKEGGDAAPEFQQLADEIDRLGQQAQALRTFQELADATDELRRAQELAETTTKDLGTQLQTLGTATQRAKTEQQEAATAAKSAGDAYTQLKNELQILRSTYDENGNRAANYKTEVERLTRAKVEQKTAFDSAKDALQQANQAVREAEAAEAKLQSTYQRSESTLNGVNTALRERSTALDGARQAADQLGVSTENVATSQAALVTSLNRVGNEAATVRGQVQLLAQAQDEYAASQQRAKKAAEDAAAAATAAARQMQNAFGNIGLRSAQELEAEIRQVRESMELVRSSAGLTGNALATAMASGNARIAELERNLREVRGQLTLADQAAGLFKNSLGQIAASNVIADGIGYLVNKVKEMGREFVTSITQLETFRRALNAIYKDTSTANSQLEFLRKSAQDAGISVGSISDSFVKFSAAMKFANVPLGEANALFAAVTRAAGTLGLSGERTTLMLDALAQMASKGTVSMEELRQQLGDSLPGALSLTAKGLGITDAQLIKLVESGNLATRDFIPAFTKALGDLRGETEGLVPTWERFKNALTLTSQNAGDSGWTLVLTAGLKALAAATGAVVLIVQSLAEGLFFVTRAAAILATGAGSLQDRLSAIGEAGQQAADRINATGQAFANAVTGADAATVAVTAATQATLTNITATDGLSRSQQAAAIASALAKDASTNLGGQYVLLSTQIATLLASQEKESEALAKLAKAAKEQGDTLVALAKVRGEEVGILEASAKASADLAIAQERVAASQQEEVNLLSLQLAALQENRKARGDTAEAIATESKALEDKITKSKAEAEQARASADAAKQELETRRLMVQVYADNSKQIEEFRQRMAQLATTLAEYQRLNLEGRKTDAEVAVIRQQLAQATALYKDALRDTVVNLRLETQEKVSNLQATLQARGAEVELYQAKAQSARNSGDLRMATYYETQAKRAKIEADKVSLEIKKIEIALEREELLIKRESLAADDPLLAQKQREIDLRLRLTDIKLREVDAGRELIRIKESELATSGSLTNALGRESSARGGVSSASARQSDAMEKLLMNYTLSADYSKRQIELLEEEAAAAEKAAEAYRKKWNIDKEGFSLNTNGERVEEFVANRRSVYEQAKGAGLSEADALKIAEQFISDQGEQTGMNGQSGKPWAIVLQEAINAAVLEAARNNTQGGMSGSGGGSASGSGTNTTTTPGKKPTGGGGGFSGGGTPVNITINGSTRSLTLGSQQDAAVLESVLRELATGQGTAS